VFLNDFDVLILKIKKNYFNLFLIENYSTPQYNKTHKLANKASCRKPYFLPWEKKS